MFGIKMGCEGTSAISESRCGTKMGVEIAVCREYVEFIRRLFFVVTAIGPRAGLGSGVFCCEVNRAEGDPKIKVGEDELDA